MLASSDFWWQSSWRAYSTPFATHGARSAPTALRIPCRSRSTQRTRDPADPRQLLSAQAKSSRGMARISSGSQHALHIDGGSSRSSCSTSRHTPTTAIPSPGPTHIHRNKFVPTQFELQSPTWLVNSIVDGNSEDIADRRSASRMRCADSRRLLRFRIREASAVETRLACPRSHVRSTSRILFTVGSFRPCFGGAIPPPLQAGPTSRSGS